MTLTSASIVVVGLAAAVLMAVATKQQRKQATTKNIKAKPIATKREQEMFWRLTEAFPASNFIVLTQVAFGALLQVPRGESRNDFSQKMADFVILKKNFEVIAEIELDDSSHDGPKRKNEDAKRDAMLTQAGYKVLRYGKVPEADKLRADVLMSVDELRTPTLQPQIEPTLD